MQEPAAGDLSTGRSAAYASGSIALDVAGPLLSWLPYLYSPPADSPGAVVLLPAATVGVLLLVGRVVDGFAEPVVGFLSDRAQTRFGRRRPFVAVGTPIMVLTLLGLFFPPFGPGRHAETAVYLVALNTIFWCAFTMVGAPYLALLPEIARSTEARTRISSMMTGFSVLVIIVGNLFLGRLVAAWHGGVEILGASFRNGFEPQVLVCGVLICFFITLAMSSVKERNHEVPDGGHLSFKNAVMESVRNPAFLPLVLPLSVFLIGTNILITAVPYFGHAVLHATEAEASLGAALVYVVAALMLPFLRRLVDHHGKKRLYASALLMMSIQFGAMPLVAVSPWPTATYLVLLGTIGVPVGTMLVLGRVLISDVIDADEKRTGLRREAMYFGMQGLMTKISFGVGPLVATQLFTRFGNTADQPLGILLCGPAAGVLGLLGWLAFRRYPLD
jgi:GPH family glycoside/pentoside/hexuronide:cation symporter